MSKVRNFIKRYNAKMNRKPKSNSVSRSSKPSKTSSNRALATSLCCYTSPLLSTGEKSNPENMTPSTHNSISAVPKRFISPLSLKNDFDGPVTMILSTESSLLSDSQLPGELLPLSLKNDFDGPVTMFLSTESSLLSDSQLSDKCKAASSHEISPTILDVNPSVKTLLSDINLLSQNKDITFLNSTKDENSDEKSLDSIFRSPEWNISYSELCAQIEHDIRSSRTFWARERSLENAKRFIPTIPEHIRIANMLKPVPSIRKRFVIDPVSGKKVLR